MTIKPHERLALTVCAYRLDPQISAASFVDILERYEDALRRDERGDIDTDSKSQLREFWIADVPDEFRKVLLPGQKDLSADNQYIHVCEVAAHDDRG